MRILTFNIRHGGGDRIPDIARSVFSQNPDVVIITEFRNNKSGALLQNILKAGGYICQYTNSTDARENTLLIVSKVFFNRDDSIYSELSEADKNRIIKINIRGNSMYGVYFPQNKAKVSLFSFLLKQATVHKNLVFMGDFNTGKHFIDESKKTFYCSDCIFDLEKEGLVDIWRHKHKETREYSWYSSKGNGFRIDHVFISEALLNKTKECFYCHDQRVKNISDHSMMILDIDL